MERTLVWFGNRPAWSQTAHHPTIGSSPPEEESIGPEGQGKFPVFVMQRCSFEWILSVPFGLMSKVVSADRSQTSVGFLMLSISLRPTRKA